MLRASLLAGRVGDVLAIVLLAVLAVSCLTVCPAKHTSLDGFLVAVLEGAGNHGGDTRKRAQSSHEEG